MKAEKIQIYAQFFHRFKLLGLLPYDFNPETLELIPTSSTFWELVFIFNTVSFLINTGSAWILFGVNWYMNFEFEELQGGYFLQLDWIFGQFLILSMLYSWTMNKAKFAAVMSTWLKLEHSIEEGK
jgi:hypothetical protein